LEVILDKPSDLKRMLGAGKCSALVKGTRTVVDFAQVSLKVLILIL